jgi:maltooligosyltrehalose trehalohydrolase
MKSGADYKGDGRCSFTVWAPLSESVTLHTVAPQERKIDLPKSKDGFFSLEVDQILPGTEYYFQLDGGVDLPDPASHFQAKDVHGPSQVVDHQAYPWKDKAWKGLPLREMIIYELHVGTFTPEGTLEAIIPRLDDLVDTGINTIELMPLAQVPGGRNWGYDGVYPYSVQSTYGTPDQFKRLVDECHQRGVAVILDMVYNHLGPEGNYFPKFGPYFTNKYCTPWGDAINFDDAWSDGIRDFFSDNAVFWAEKYHLDGLRLDAIHAIFDNGAVHFWELTRQKVDKVIEKTGRPFYLMAESDLNSPKVIQSPDINGYGFDAQWLDDFHHSLYVLLNERGKKRYEDFGTMEQLAKAFKEGFVHSGEYVIFRKRKHGRSSAEVPGEHFIAFIQNHDQVGNHPRGQRLGRLLDLERLKLGAAALLLSPYVPLLFMGEEYGEDNPFYYFVSHTDEELIKAVREGRKEEFVNFNWNVEPPDPQSTETFTASKLSWEKRKQGKYRVLHQWYKELIHLRKTHPALQSFDKQDVHLQIQDQVLALYRKNQQHEVVCLFNFAEQAIPFTAKTIPAAWKLILNSNESKWQDPSQSTVVQPVSFKDGKITVPPLTILLYELLK